MNFLLLASIISGMLFQSVSRKNCNSGAFTFSFVCALFSALFFVLTASFKLKFNISLFPYVIAFALSFSMAIVGIFFAIKSGSLSLSSLASSYSLIIPCIYGLIFLKETSSAFLYASFLFLFLSFTLINVKKGDNKITALWVIYALMVFLGNGFCATIQKMQQVAFNEAYKNEFMSLSLLLVSVFMLFFVLFREKNIFIASVKEDFLWMVGCGLTNGAVNLFTMILAGKMATSIMFPLISAGGIIATWIVSRFFYRERLTIYQNIGLLLGIAAVIFLNL